MMKGILTAILAMVTLSVFSQTARLQVIHNSPDPVVDVYLDGTLLLDDFAFRTATPYVDVPADVLVNIDIAPSTSTSVADAIANFPITFADGETYVALASGIVGDMTTPFTLNIKTMARETATGSDVEFIAVHGSPDAPAVDVVARGVATLVPGAAYGDITDYIGVAPGAYVLDITPAGAPFTIVASYDADLSGLGGGTAVVFASGFLGGASPAFGLYAALADGTVIAFPTVAPTTTIVQVIHNSPTPTVDIYLNDVLLLDDFMFRTATPFVNVPAEVPIQFKIAPETSTSAADAIAAFSGTLRSDKGYVCIASGVLGDPTTPFDLRWQGNIKPSNPFNKVRFVTAHGSPDAPTVDIETGGIKLNDDLEYGQISRYNAVPPASYIIDVATADDSDSVIVASFVADLSGLSGGNAVVFASGFLSGASPAFGIFAALADGTVVEFPAAPPRIANPNAVTTSVLFPIPAKEFAQFTLNSTNDQEANLQVFGIDGSLVIDRSLDITAGNQMVTLDLSDLNTGTYVMAITGATGLLAQEKIEVVK